MRPRFDSSALSHTFPICFLLPQQLNQKRDYYNYWGHDFHIKICKKSESLTALLDSAQGKHNGLINLKAFKFPLKNETFQGASFSEVSIVNFCPFQLKISMVRKCCTQAVHPHNLSHILYRFLKARSGLAPEALPLGNVPSI